MFTYKFRMYPGRRSERLLNEMLTDLRDTYNWALNERRQHYRDNGESLGWDEQSRRLTKRRADDPKLGRWSAGVAQETVKQVHLAFGAFFRRIAAGESPGYPRFKSEKRLSSATFVVGKGGASYYAANDRHYCKPKRRTDHKASSATINIMGIGHLKVKQHRLVEGDIKTLTIKRERHKWYVTIVTDYVPAQLPKTGVDVGVDVGKDNFIATSDGLLVVNPRFLDQQLKALAAAQQLQAACVGGTKEKRQAGEIMSSSAKQRSKITGDVHEKIRDCRADFHNKLACQLVTAADTIYVEDLDIAGMIDGDPQFNDFTKTAENRNTYDAGWGIFIKKLICKAVSAGKTVIEVDPSYTSQRCHECGHIDKGNRKHKRFCCLRCGHEAHADINAARNIKARGEGVTFRSWRPPPPEPANS